MSTSNFNLRGLSPEIMLLLKQEAQREHMSINTLVLKLIEQSLGFTRKKKTYHDLDHLAGSWSKAEAENFEKNTRSFEQIDYELWK